MTKIRTFKKFTIVYTLEKEEKGFYISIVKDDQNGKETSAFTVCGDERELKSLLCRMWGCSVTPMSLRYILQDEGFLPHPVIEESCIKIIEPRIVRRKPAKRLEKTELVASTTNKA